MKVLVTGAAGQLGRAFTEHHGAAQIVGWTRSDVDITKHSDVRDAIEILRPDVIVNCASFNHVDLAEDEQVTALEVNAIAVGNLARAAAAVDAVFVHYSTDFVFAARQRAVHGRRSAGAAQRLCPVEVDRGMAGGRRANALRAPRREPVRRPAPPQQHRSNCRAADRRRAGAGVLRPSRLAKFRRRRRRRVVVCDLAAAGIRPLSLRERRPRDVAGGRPGDRALPGPDGFDTAAGQRAGREAARAAAAVCAR